MVRRAVIKRRIKRKVPVKEITTKKIIKEENLDLNPNLLIQN